MAATAAPVAPPSNAAIPGATAPKKPKKPKEKKPKSELPLFSALKPDAEGNPTVKLKSAEGYDPTKFAPLKRNNFECESFFMEYQADQLTAKAAKLREDAKKVRELGSSNTGTKAKTLLKITERMEELIASLKADGFDVDSLLAQRKK